MTVNREYQIDPVCGMAVTSPAAPSLSWRGREYRFCEEACRDTFLDDPGRWTEPMHHVDQASTSV